MEYDAQVSLWFSFAFDNLQFFFFSPQLFLTFSGLVSRPPDICPTWFILCASVGLSSPWAIYVKRGEHFPLKCILTDNLA